MPKDSKFGWSDMFKLDTVPSNEEGVETPDTTQEVENEVETLETETTTEEVETTEVEEAEEIETPETTSTTTTVETKIDPKEKTTEVNDNVFAPIVKLIESGVLSYDENKEYDNSPEGVKEVILENINKGIENWKKELPEDALKIVEHIKAGGTVRDFIELESEPDYQNEVDLTLPTHQQYLVEDWLEAQGYTEDERAAKIKKYTDAGLLEDEAKEAQTKLIALQERKKNDLIAAQKKAADARKLENERKVTDFKTKVLETKEIAGFKLADGEQSELFDYIMKPVKDGKTQMQLDYNDEAQLKIALLMKRKFDFSTIQAKAQTKATIKLKEAINRTKDTAAKAKGTTVARKEEDGNESSDTIYGLPWQGSRKKK